MSHWVSLTSRTTDRTPELSHCNHRTLSGSSWSTPSPWFRRWSPDVSKEGIIYVESENLYLDSPCRSSPGRLARVVAETLEACPTSKVNSRQFVSVTRRVSPPAHSPTSWCSSGHGSRCSGCRSLCRKCSKSPGASWSQNEDHSSQSADWFQSSRVKPNITKVGTHFCCQSGRDLFWNSQQFLCWSGDLGFESERATTEAWISWINDYYNRYLYRFSQIVEVPHHHLITRTSIAKFFDSM